MSRLIDAIRCCKLANSDGKKYKPGSIDEWHSPKKLNPKKLKEFDDTDDATRATLPRPVDHF